MDRGLAESRTRAQALILAGQVRVGDGDTSRSDRKPGDLVDPAIAVRLTERLPYVSRGGHKLAAALDAFGIDPTDRVCLDVGASTGGGGRGPRFGYGYVVNRPFREIEQLDRQGDPRAVEFVKTFFRHFGRALANLINVLDPDVVVVYGNPAQLMRLIHAASLSLGERVSGEFGGKVECSSYLIAPYRSGEIKVVIPGMGDRIFSMTQDDEMVVAFPGKFLDGLLVGLKDAGKKIGARYPVTFYQNFSPSFPPAYEERAKKWGIL